MLDNSSIDYNTLMDLVYDNNLSTLRHYLSMGLDPSIKSDSGEPLFHLAIKEENLEMVQLFLDYRVDVEITNYQGNNALIFSAEKGNAEILNLLITNHVNLNQSYNLDGSTPLIIAVWNNHEIFSQEILKQPININEINKYEISALGYAAYINNFNLVNLLLSHQANLNLISPSGRTVLNLLCEESNQLDMIKYLLVKGANPNQIRWEKVNTYIIEELKVFIDDLHLKNQLEERLINQDDDESESGSTDSGKGGNAKTQTSKKLIKI